ncbi:hypothetical protein ACWCQL_04100 [Streptomyces sp. NPDC002073]
MSGSGKSSTTRRVRAALSAAVVVCAVTAALPGAAWAEPTEVAGAADDRPTAVERISVAADGSPADGNSAGGSITPDGRYVVFSSSAANLTPDTATGGDRAFIRDQQTGQTKRIGSQSPLEPPVISGNGDFIAFAHQWMRNVRIRQDWVSTGQAISANCSAYSCNQPTLSSDGHSIALAILMRTPTLNRQTIEVQDWSTKQTVASLGHTLPSRPSISGDGLHVAYEDGQTRDVFLWDRTTGTTSGPVEGPSKAAALVQLSDDSSKIVYLSGSDTYVHDVASGTAQLVANARGVAIDPTGRFLLYAPQDTSGPSLVLRDLQAGTDEVVSVQPATAGTDAVSAGGHDVVFRSTVDGIVPGDTNGKADVFVRHFL